jgi:hypothetical protein
MRVLPSADGSSASAEQVGEMAVGTQAVGAGERRRGLLTPSLPRPSAAFAAGRR